MATYSNSSLVNYTKISPNKNTTRKHSTHNPTGVIDRITIHHMAGNGSIETLGEVFAPVERQASSNYGIGTDGRVGLYVDEKHRAWTSSSPANDYRAVTIEVANDGGDPDWHVSNKALAKLIDLCADICKRNGIKKLNYTGDTTGNLTMHKWFAVTSCPGPYLASKFPYIAEAVNIKLGVVKPAPVTPKPTNSFKEGEIVKLAAKATYITGQAIPTWVRNQTLYVRGVYGDKLAISTQQTGAITGMVYVRDVIKVSAPASTTTSNASKFAVGDKVKLVQGAKYASGGSIPAWVLNVELYVRAINGNNITISTVQTGAITGVVKDTSVVACGATAPKFESYIVRVTVDNLNIRKGAGTNYAVVGAIKDRGAYTIIDENNGWGYLKSKAGWINLKYTKRV